MGHNYLHIVLVKFPSTRLPCLVLGIILAQGTQCCRLSTVKGGFHARRATRGHAGAAPRAWLPQLMIKIHFVLPKRTNTHFKLKTILLLPPTIPQHKSLPYLHPITKKKNRWVSWGEGTLCVLQTSGTNWEFQKYNWQLNAKRSILWITECFTKVKSVPLYNGHGQSAPFTQGMLEIYRFLFYA